MSKVIEGLYYAESHEFVKVEGDFGYVGITDFAQSELGNIVYVDLPDTEEEIEAGEDHLSALERELIEELGFTAKVGKYYGQADEYFYSRHRDRYFYNPAYIYEITSFEQSQKPLEDFNQLAWFPIDEAIEKLKRGSHEWGVEMWKMEHQAK